MADDAVDFHGEPGVGNGGLDGLRDVENGLFFGVDGVGFVRGVVAATGDDMEIRVAKGDADMAKFAVSVRG